MNVGSGWWVLGPIMMIAFWGSIFWLIAKSIGRRPDPPTADPGIGAKEIAARRFASGEITEAEYNRILDRLQV